MAESRIVGYKKIFGLVLPDWVNEGMIRSFGAGLLSAAVMLLTLIFYIWPNMETIKTRENQLKTDQSALDQLKRSQDGLNKMSSEISPTTLKTILSAIPQQYAPDSAIYLLRRIGSDTGVSIVSYTLPGGVLLDTESGSANSKSANMVDFSTFPIKITVLAPVDALLKFIAKVETSLPFGVVSDLNLQEVTKLSKTSLSKDVEMELEINYYQAILGNVNLSKLQPLSEIDLATIRLLEGYSLLLVNGETDTTTPIPTGSGNIFGF